jgi:cold shock CspA family protein
VPDDAEYIQGTVRHYSPERHDGSVLLDDGSLVEFGENAFERSGLRLLRTGQRVRLRLADDGHVAALTVLTLPL